MERDSYLGFYILESCLLNYFGKSFPCDLICHTHAKSLSFFSLSEPVSHTSELKTSMGQFLGGSVVRILALSLPRAWVQSLIRELRSHRLQGGAKKIN